MKPQEHTDCVDLLLDFVLYEQYRRRLSPEIEYLLEEHLEGCPSCRERILAFQQMLGEEIAQRNVG